MQKVFPTCFAVLIAVKLCLFSSTPRLKADDGQFLNFVIYNLPPEYFADIPLEERSSFLRILSKSPKDKRLDYQNKYLHWYSDGGSISASSQLRVKLFPRKRTRLLPGCESPLRVRSHAQALRRRIGSRR